MRNTMMMVVLGLALITTAHAAENTQHETTPATNTVFVASVKATEEAPKPSESKEEFAGFTMFKFFQKSVQAVSDCTKTHGIPGGDSIRIAAY